MGERGGGMAKRAPRGSAGAPRGIPEAPGPSERALQAAVAEYLGWSLPPSVFWTAIPGGDGRETRAPGWRSGAPDILLIWRGRAIGIELKTATGRQRAEQRAAELAWTLAGGVCTVCRSVPEVQAFLEVLGVPLRGRVSA